MASQIRISPDQMRERANSYQIRIRECTAR